MQPGCAVASPSSGLPKSSSGRSGGQDTKPKHLHPPMHHPFLATNLTHLPAPPVLGRDEEPAPAVQEQGQHLGGDLEPAPRSCLSLACSMPGKEVFSVDDQLALLGRRL